VTRRDACWHETHFPFLGALGTTSYDRNLQHLFEMFMFISFVSSPFLQFVFSVFKIYLAQFLFIHYEIYMYLHSIWKYTLRLHARKHENTILCSYFLLHYFLIYFCHSMVLHRFLVMSLKMIKYMSLFFIEKNKITTLPTVIIIYTIFVL
jgi:hypothetical protein